MSFYWFYIEWLFYIEKFHGVGKLISLHVHTDPFDQTSQFFDFLLYFPMLIDSLNFLNALDPKKIAIIVASF